MSRTYRKHLPPSKGRVPNRFRTSSHVAVSATFQSGAGTHGPVSPARRERKVVKQQLRKGDWDA